jgi:mannose-6-phosphate isomerase
VQNYDWGKFGAASSVARLWSAATEPSGAIDEARPYAELWLGTHPSGPARLASADGSSALGPLLRDHLGADLPFLLKNLSVNKALSIQAHPNKSLAARLHASAPQHYKDANHKPEMAIAIGDFQCMCGFRPVADIGACLRGVPELRAMIGDAIVERFEGAAAAGDEAAIKRALRAVFEAVMKCARIHSKWFWPVDFLMSLISLRYTSVIKFLFVLHSQFPILMLVVQAPT